MAWVAVWGEHKPMLTMEALIERTLIYCDWAVAKGLLPVDALLDVKRQVAPYIDLQLVAFPQDGVLRIKGGVDNLKRALAKGVDVVGGIPHFERTMLDGAASVKLLCELAAERGLLVDMHCDQSDDPLSHHIETLAFEAQRLGLQGRVNGSHCTSMHNMDKLLLEQAAALDRRERSQRDHQPANQHQASGPTRQLPQTTRQDPRVRAAGRWCQRRLRPRLRDGPPVWHGQATCSRWHTWVCTWRR